MAPKKRGRPKGSKNKTRKGIGYLPMGDDTESDRWLHSQPIYLKGSSKTTKGKGTKMHGQSYNNQGSFGGGTNYTSHYCGHTGSLKVFELDGRQLYAAGSSIHVDPKTRLVIDLAGSANSEFKSVANFVDSDSAPALREQLVIPVRAQRLRLNWNDMAAPPYGVGLAFWQKVWELMPHDPDDADGNKTIVCCMGGHGRTGTCLAALLICNGGFSMPNAVNYVRYHHCVKAVESKVQIDYLRDLSVAAGTNTQPRDEELAAMLDALEEPAPTKGVGSHTSSAPTITSPALVSGKPPEMVPLTAERLLNAKEVLVLTPDKSGEKTNALSPTWVSMQTYHLGTYGDKLAILGVRYAK